MDLLDTGCLGMVQLELESRQIQSDMDLHALHAAVLS